MTRGQRLAELRGKRTQREIADAIGVRPQAVSNWERDVNEVDRDKVAALDTALGADGEVVGLYGYAPTGPSTGAVSLADVDRKLDDLSAQVTSDIAAATEAVAELLAAILRRLPDRPSRAVRRVPGDRQSQPSAG